MYRVSIYQALSLRIVFNKKFSNNNGLNNCQYIGMGRDSKS